MIFKINTTPPKTTSSTLLLHYIRQRWRTPLHQSAPPIPCIYILWCLISLVAARYDHNDPPGTRRRLPHNRSQNKNHPLRCSIANKMVDTLLNALQSTSFIRINHLVRRSVHWRVAPSAHNTSENPKHALTPVPKQHLTRIIVSHKAFHSMQPSTNTEIYFIIKFLRSGTLLCLTEVNWDQVSVKFCSHSSLISAVCRL